MKKYFGLIAGLVIAIMFVFQIPNISNELAKECVTVSVINDVASERVFCKGFIEKTNDDFVVKAQISEEDISKVAIEKTVEISCKALGDKILYSKVETISDYAYEISYGGVNVTVVDAIIKFDESYDGLKKGYNVTAEIIYTEVKNAAILPFECVAQEKNGRYYVYRIDDNWAVKEYVNVAFEDEKGAVILGDCDFDTVCEEPERFSGDDYVRIKNVGTN